MALANSETIDQYNEERMRRERIEAAQQERSERGYKLLALYTAEFHADTLVQNARLPIRDRVQQVARDLDAVMRCHGMRLSDVLDR